MPRCYKVTVREDGKTVATRYAGTQAGAKALRNEMAERRGLNPRKNASVEEAEIPAAKTELLEFVNELCEKMDVGRG